MLNPYKSYTWFSNEFVLKKSTQGWYAMKCPMCNELVDRKKGAVHFKYEMVKCWICGYKERIIDFVMMYANVDYLDAKDLINRCKESSIDLEYLNEMETVTFSEVKLPVGYHSILDGAGVLATRARNHLLGRGFDLEELDRIGVGYCNEQALVDEENFLGYIIIPFKSKGMLVYYIGRDFIGNFLRYKNPPKAQFGIGKGDLIFNEDALNLYNEVFCSEGWADAFEMGRKGISTQGWSLSKTQKTAILSGSCEKVIFIPDIGEDNTGRSFYSKAVETAIDFIDHKEVYVLDLMPFKDLGKDSNEIGRKNVLECYKNSSPLSLESAAEILTQ